jgi:hypothetical protein
MQIARTRSSVQPLRIAFFANVQRCIHVNFKEAADFVANFVTGRPIGRNGSHQGDDSVARQ